MTLKKYLTIKKTLKKFIMEGIPLTKILTEQEWNDYKIYHYNNYIKRIGK